MNTREINNYIYNLTAFELFSIDDKFFVVNLDHLTNRNYQNQAVNEFFYVAGEHKNKIFIFLARDGVNCNLTGLTQIVTQTIKNLNLNANTCFFYGYENYEIENCTFIEFDVLQMWCHSTFTKINDLPLSSSVFTKKFAALFGRHDVYRCKIAKYLVQNYQQDSIVSYNSHIAQWHNKFADDFFLDDQQWYRDHCPILLDFENAQGWVSYEKSLENIHKHYQKYFVEIVCETDIFSNKFFTEKTLKNFYLGKPFILYSGPGSLHTLKNNGFKTFDSIIDESYDEILCPNARYKAILREIDKLAVIPYPELTNIYQNLQQVFEHNRENYKKLLTR